MKKTKTTKEKLNLEWLENEIRSIKNDSMSKKQGLAEIAQQLEYRLNQVLLDFLRLPKWSLLEFITLISGFYLLEKLKEKKYVKSPDRHEQARGIVHKKYLSATFTEIALKRTSEYFRKYLKVFNSFVDKNEITNHAPALNWLEIADKVNCRKMRIQGGCYMTTAINMANRIKYANFKLKIQDAENGTSVPTYTLQEAAKELGTNENEIIKICLDKNIGVYLNEARFKVKTIRTIPAPPTSEIKKFSKQSHKYNFKGLVRLLNTAGAYPKELTVKQFYNASYIKVRANNDYEFVPLLPSLAEYIVGLSRHIELRRSQKITPTDLLFIKEEIDKLKAELQPAIQKNLVTQESKTKDSKNKTTSAAEADKRSIEKDKEMSIMKNKLEKISKQNSFAAKSKNKELRSFVINTYKNRKFKSKLSAAKIIFPLTQKYAKENSIRLLRDDTGERAVYDWIRKI